MNYKEYKNKFFEKKQLRYKECKVLSDGNVQN